MSPLKQRSLESVILAIFFTVTNMWLFTSQVNSNKELFTLIVLSVSLACFYFIIKDLKLLISMSKDFSPLESKFDVIAFLLCVVIIFNSLLTTLDVRSLDFSTTMFILICLLPIYLLFLLFSLHLLLLHKKRKKVTVNSYFISLFLFALLSASLVFSSYANIVLSFSYLVLSLVVMTYIKRESMKDVSSTS